MNRLNQSPFQLFGNLDRFLTNALQPSLESPHPHRVYRSDDAVRIELDLPGISREDLKISREGRSLRVSAKHDNEGSFNREFKLSTDFDLNAISAKHTDGVLRIDLPKTQADDLATQDIQIN